MLHIYFSYKLDNSVVIHFKPLSDPLTIRCCLKIVWAFITNELKYACEREGVGVGVCVCVCAQASLSARVCAVGCTPERMWVNVPLFGQRSSVCQLSVCAV